MRVGDLVRFKTHDSGAAQVGLLLRYDKVLKVGEILVDTNVHYAPGRLIETHQRGKRSCD